MQLIGRVILSQGSGLIEVLAALFIIAVGVLGMAGIHTKALQHNQSAYVHSRATFLATDMLDRIRANAALARTSDSYQVSPLQDVFADCETDSYPSSCETASCTPQQMAIYDIQQWKFHLNCELPDTTGEVSFSNIGNERLFTIRLNFPENRQGYPVDDLTLRGAL
ncbi:type IV pilus modification protein PilV [Endozoicomonas sp. (ex Bugula neritina AB1)]|nr:type IV pilus modification protein PilV [Endozoicomonas sp. (ex Bugula neritina AB1)]